MSKILNVNMTGAEYLAAKEAQAASERTAARPELSFDGWGINGPDEYRTRLCTFNLRSLPGEVVDKYAAMFASAPETAAQRDELLAALRMLLPLAVAGLSQAPTHDGLANCEALAQARAAIAQADAAKGGAK